MWSVNVFPNTRGLLGSGFLRGSFVISSCRSAALKLDEAYLLGPHRSQGTGRSFRAQICPTAAAAMVGAGGNCSRLGRRPGERRSDPALSTPPPTPAPGLPSYRAPSGRPALLQRACPGTCGDKGSKPKYTLLPGPTQGLSSRTHAVQEHACSGFSKMPFNRFCYGPLVRKSSPG